MPQFLSTTDADFETRFQSLLNAKREDSPDVDHVVAEIIADVRARGDAHASGVLERSGQRLLARDVLARLAHGAGLLRVDVVGRPHVDQVHRGRGGHARW